MTQTLNLPGIYNLVTFDSVSSTNDEAKKLAEQGEDAAPDGTLVWARSQSAGRGRRGREWFGAEGNLYCSLILRPDAPAIEATQLGYVAALAIYDTIGELCPPGYEAHCKWPNDVLLNSKKVSGILMESSGSSPDGHLDWLILGVGINVATHPDDTPYPATSFAAEGARDISVEDTLASFSRNFLVWCRRWMEDGFEGLRETWVWRAAGLNEEILVRLENQELSGIFAGIDENGALRLRQNENEQTITVGDVFFPNHKT